jgi:hypothetical protein
MLAEWNWNLALHKYLHLQAWSFGQVYLDPTYIPKKSSTAGSRWSQGQSGLQPSYTPENPVLMAAPIIPLKQLKAGSRRDEKVLWSSRVHYFTLGPRSSPSKSRKVAWSMNRCHTAIGRRYAIACRSGGIVCLYCDWRLVSNSDFCLSKLFC